MARGCRGWYGIYNATHGSWWCLYPDGDNARQEFSEFPENGVKYGEHVVFIGDHDMVPALKSLLTMYCNVHELNLVGFKGSKIRQHTVVYYPNFSNSWPLGDIISEHNLDVTF